MPPANELQSVFFPFEFCYLVFFFFLHSRLYVNNGRVGLRDGGVKFFSFFFFVCVADGEETCNVLTFKHRLGVMFSEESATESTRSDESRKKIQEVLRKTIEIMGFSSLENCALPRAFEHKMFNEQCTHHRYFNVM